MNSFINFKLYGEEIFREKEKPNFLSILCLKISIIAVFLHNNGKHFFNIVFITRKLIVILKLNKFFIKKNIFIVFNLKKCSLF